MRQTRWILFVIFGTLFAISGCQAPYLIKSALSQADLLMKRVPLEDALKDPSLSDDKKHKLQLAQKARQFAERDLGLKTTKNYT